MLKQNFNILMISARRIARRDWFYFFDLVVIARAKHPIPSRTRQLSAAALMVLRLKAWESKSLPNLISKTRYLSLSMHLKNT